MGAGGVPCEAPGRRHVDETQKRRLLSLRALGLFASDLHRTQNRAPLVLGWLVWKLIFFRFLTLVIFLG